MLVSQLHQNKHVTDFKERAEIFNFFFADDLFLINNSSKLDLGFLKRTENVISFLLFNRDDIAKIIRDLDPNKPLDHDIRVRMFKFVVSTF